MEQCFEGRQKAETWDNPLGDSCFKVEIIFLSTQILGMIRNGIEKFKDIVKSSMTVIWSAVQLQILLIFSNFLMRGVFDEQLAIKLADAFDEVASSVSDEFCCNILSMLSTTDVYSNSETELTDAFI